MNPDSGLQSRVSQLRQRFLERCLTEVDQLEALVAHADSAHDASPAETLRLLAHRMAGAGATLGFAEISDEARNLEMLLREHPAERPIDPSARETIRHGLTQLRAVVSRLQSDS